MPFTKSKFVYSYDGKVIAGIDFAKILVNVDQDKRTIYLTVPTAEILSCDIDEDSFKLCDEHRNILNPASVEDLAISFKEMKDDETLNALEKGILKDAQRNAKSSIYEFVSEICEGTNYKIEVDCQTNN